MTRYAFFGGTLSTSLHLYALPQLHGDALAEEDIILEIGTVPDALSDVIWSSPFISLARDGTALVEIASAGRFFVCDGRKISFAPASDALPSVVESIVLSIVAGVILHQRGALPLHASCLTYNGKTVALAGPTGRGKSTLAVALLKRGADLVAEDITVLRLENGIPMALQGALGLRLWPDAVEAVAGREDVWIPVRPGHAKHMRPLSAAPMPPRRLDAVLRLEIANSNEAPGVTELHGAAAVMPMTDLVYRVHLGRQMGRREELFRNVMRLAQTVPVLQVRRPDDLARLDDTVALVAAAIDRIPDHA